MTDAKQFHTIQMALESADYYDLVVWVTDEIHVKDKHGKHLNSGFKSAEEFAGWMDAYGDFKQGLLK